MRMLRWYRDFVRLQIRDLPKGKRERGWTIFGLWSMLLVPFVILILGVAYFLGLAGLLVLMGLLLILEIIFRIVDYLDTH